MASSRTNWPTLALGVLAVLVHFLRSRTTDASMFQAHPSHPLALDPRYSELLEEDAAAENGDPELDLQHFRIQNVKELHQHKLKDASLASREDVWKDNDEKLYYGRSRNVQNESFEKENVSSYLAPLLNLYTSITSGHLFAKPDKENIKAGVTSNNRPVPTASVKSFKPNGNAVPFGPIHDIALDPNDTHHFYWRLYASSDSLQRTTSMNIPRKIVPNDDVVNEELNSWKGRETGFPFTKTRLGKNIHSQRLFSDSEKELNNWPSVVGVRCEVHSRGTAPMPWIAIGFSDRGQLKGADLCVFWIDWKNQNVLVDGHERMVDGAQNVCRNFRFSRQRGLLRLTFYRELDTCLPGHYVIERGTTHLVWSYGAGPLYQLVGVLAAGDQTGSVMVELLKPPVQLPAERAARELKVTVKAVSIPAEETNYWCSVQKLPEHFKNKHHILEYRSSIQHENKDIVHHMEVFHCEYPPEKQVPLYQGPCHAADRPREIDACKRVLAAWAMGAVPFSYPAEAGLPLGGPDFNPFIMLEVHYNNPLKAQGRVDSSGITLTYTEKLRQHDAAIMELGLEYTEKMAIPPRVLAFQLSGYCVPQCTALSIPPSGIFIFGSQLHTHLTGARAWLKHFRDGRELSEPNRDNHFSTHFQEIRRLPRHVHVLPGDMLTMTCEYTTLDRDNATIGGFAISDEMCVSYVHYYPKIDLEVCKSSVDTTALHEYFEFMNKYELQDTSPSKDWRENYHSIQWTPLRALFLKDFYENSPLSMQCNKSSGSRFPGFWDELSIPEVIEKLPPHTSNCGSSSG
ncbi:Copper type II ascorbate-dependent monooxygenase N-terminal [Trinorchestia longiramus]|nr:Copper type II ascorbate-dependent monooxygenase N-terminal [Trinorchestia longiramus]